MNIHGISTKWATFLGRKSVNEQDVDIYAYGIEYLLNYFITYGVIIAIGCLLGFWWETITWIVFWTFLRSKIGGSHAKSHLACFVVSVLLGIISVLLSQNLLNNFMSSILIIGIIYSNLIIFICAPIEHPNKPCLSEKTYKKTRLLARSYSIFVTALIIILNSIFPPIASILLVTMIGVSTMALIGYFQYPKSAASQ